MRVVGSPAWSISTVQSAVAESQLDGQGRVLLRASGTEPLVRVMVEAPTVELANAVAADLAGIVRHRFS